MSSSLFYSVLRINSYKKEKSSESKLYFGVALPFLKVIKACLGIRQPDPELPGHCWCRGSQMATVAAKQPLWEPWEKRTFIIFPWVSPETCPWVSSSLCQPFTRLGLEEAFASGFVVQHGGQGLEVEVTTGPNQASPFPSSRGLVNLPVQLCHHWMVCSGAGTA